MTPKLTRVVALVVLLAAHLSPAGRLKAAQETGDLDAYGGWTAVSRDATGRFRVDRLDELWWLLDPEGRPFYSIGVNKVSFRPDVTAGGGRSAYGGAAAVKYGSPGVWARAVVARLRSWGFNTLGALSDPVTWRQGMPYTVTLDLSRRGSRVGGQALPDVFAPTYRRTALGLARRMCRPLADDPWLVGYFLDDEPPWGRGDGGPERLFAQFLQLADQAPGRQAVLRFLEDRYSTEAALNDAWGTQYESFEQIGRIPQPESEIPESDRDDFLGVVAERYFAIGEEAVRSADGQHLILGCRLAGLPPTQALEAMRGHVDVVSLNDYGEGTLTETVREIHRVTGLPILITQFGFPTYSGSPDESDASATGTTPEEQRGERFEQYVKGLTELPMVVGYHWCEHADSREGGESESADANRGLVDVRDQPHAELVEAARRVNHTVYTARTVRGASPGRPPGGG